jgi:hypothetical protein
VDGGVDGSVERVDMGEGLMGEVIRLEVAPDDFDVVEFWSVFGQPHDGEPVRPGREGGQRELAEMDRSILLDQLGEVRRGPAPGQARKVANAPAR